MRALLIVNPRSGDGSIGTDELVAAARARGVETHVLREGDELEAIARDSDAAAVGMVGGDGSLAPVAQACIEGGKAFVCVPFGTRNHFARDAGIDRDDPLGAVAAFDETAEERRVDVGRVNGRVFLNNVSFGLYAGLVHERERRRRQREAFARLMALTRLVSTPHAPTLLVDGAPLGARLVLVANNAYTPVRALSLGERERLDEGRLYLYVACGLLPDSWEERSLEHLVLDVQGGSVRAAIDGEPAHLDAPLELSIEPQALRIRVPAVQGDG